MKYRTDRINELNNAFNIREQAHMELNGMTFSEYYLINRQMDLAYNPPKENEADSRIVSGLVHEKDQTIISIIMDMNFMPKVIPLDPTDKELVDYCKVFTAQIKRSLKIDNFRDKQEDAVRLLVSQGNVFATNKKYEKWKINKTKVRGGDGKKKLEWNTTYEKEYDYCTTEILPNTGVYAMNIREGNIHRQPRMFYVMHYPVSQVAQVWKDNPRWESVPKGLVKTIPGADSNGMWGDYFLMEPQNGFVEVIYMESEIFNEYQVWINGVQMLPIQEENGLVTGYPLTEVSPGNRYSMAKGDYERIPFFWISKSNPSKNQVKEEEINEVMRLMVLMLRQKVNPPSGNLSTRVLKADIWNPGKITPDLKKDDLQNLTPHNGINQSEFSFYQMLQNSVAETSVSASADGTAPEQGTATVYLDQKRSNLKKLGLSLDRTIEFLRELYWIILSNEISAVDQKTKNYSTDGTFKEAYRSFSVEDTVDGRKGNVTVNYTDDTSEVDPYDLYKQTEEMDGPSAIHHVKPKTLKEVLMRMRDKIYIEVPSEPEGEQLNLMAQLFNLLTQYSNLKGGDTRKVNFDYLETIISDNSGFDQNKIFLDEPLEPQPVPGAPVPSNIALNQNPSGASPGGNAVLANQ